MEVIWIQIKAPSWLKSLGSAYAIFGKMFHKKKKKKDYEEMQIHQNNHKVLHSNHKEMKYQDREENWLPLVS